ncbi:hypothetical protein L596_012037 [Steinernema carpocapsae]|uniref:RING-type E3 ubiquitin transferase n=1 Tax=Steinernema carpocapsae TaxID=34508 RepID=A0A4U5NWQ9_STECR|nr:hypothetical protein L596_012037 [Steinernema carpocapsae]
MARSRTCVDLLSEEDICRICEEPGTPKNLLITPCECRGTIAFAHCSCILKWLDYTNPGKEDGEIKVQCTSCTCWIKSTAKPTCGTISLQFGFILLFLVTVFMMARSSEMPLGKKIVFVLLGTIVVCCTFYKNWSIFGRKITHVPAINGRPDAVHIV